MKTKIISLLLFIGVVFNSIGQEIAPFIRVTASSESMQQVSEKVMTTLKNHSFIILGKYHPSNKSSLEVIAFTNLSMKNTVIKVKDRGALSAIFKVGLQKKNGKVTVSYTNPEYLLRAYLGKNYKIYKNIFVKFSTDVKTALKDLGNDFIAFGGTVKARKLKKYHYKIMMPYFSDPIELKEFSSFEEGLRVIQNNLKDRKGKTELVYQLIYKQKKVAVFGIGLLDIEDGEPKFLPKIGASHLAALPYEIILQDKKVTMLHGKYRLALFWPELSMGTFMRIMSTPGNIEDMLESICE